MESTLQLEATLEQAIDLGLRPEEFEAIKGILYGDYAIADELHATELSLPISAGHTMQDVEFVSEIIGQFK